MTITLALAFMTMHTRGYHTTFTYRYLAGMLMWLQCIFNTSLWKVIFGLAKSQRDRMGWENPHVIKLRLSHQPPSGDASLIAKFDIKSLPIDIQWFVIGGQEYAWELVQIWSFSTESQILHQLKWLWHSQCLSTSVRECLPQYPSVNNLWFSLWCCFGCSMLTGVAFLSLNVVLHLGVFPLNFSNSVRTAVSEQL